MNEYVHAIRTGRIREFRRNYRERLEAARKLIVATKEGGAITGEEWIREHLDSLYGAVNNREATST